MKSRRSKKKMGGHACPLGPGNGSRRSSGTTAAAGVGTACHPHTLVFVESFSLTIVAHVETSIRWW